MAEVNYNRILRTTEVSELDVEYISLRSLRQEIDTLIERYGEDAWVEREDRAYSDSQYVAVKTKRPETDEEMHYRISREEDQKKRVDEHNRKLYESLKKQFGGLE
jgi:hypothetical protein